MALKPNGSAQKKRSGERVRSDRADKGPFGGVCPNGCGQDPGEVRRVGRAAQKPEALPGIRPEKIAGAKKRIAERFYDRAEVAEKIAERLLEDLGVWR